MTSLFTINCCKSFGCKNLGLASSPDYSWPEYRLGYAALHCRACGSYPPLFNEEQFGGWLSAYLTDFAAQSGHFCPRCYQRETILYGHNPQGSQRVQCRSCKHVWTPKQQPLTTIVPPEQIATVPLIVPFQGACTDQKLYVLLSFDAIRGNILHISSNFTPHLVGDTLRYRWRNNVEPAVIHDNIVERVRQRETLFLRRSQFDEIQYGSAMLKRNANGAVLRPVITAHGHFRILSHLWPEVKTHIIAHECFLRGAAITAWAQQYRDHHASLWFIDEEITSDKCTLPWRLLGKTWQGWWQNQWQIWQQGDTRKMVCLLTDGQVEKGASITLAAGHHFLAWLQQQAEFRDSARYSAHSVFQTIRTLAEQYNTLITQRDLPGGAAAYRAYGSCHM
ncbi:cytoplasmic protein [Citrobacter freundii]|uniref:cytoplasmic protein n=1 Tax=Citrobacter freundii TaxID=546 RepID=UPI001908114E|nr:cytoplasmic protein [Citrobacter freundii]EJM7591006.1 cytoplasmic protein [Citrobacter freundii]EKW0743575.1 cytoplasmic protein [Citrobacter freundii]ELP5235690.1 cytoplasmic protein [Citrobacter freundii]MBJ9038848.1 cytoplasmic protein [Citrobacter freundii]MCH9318619.1 cytoplasmic protein [Citrobacter freundii]